MIIAILPVRLGMAYSGSHREDVQELLSPFISDTTLNMEIASLAALSLGLVFVGSCHGDITSTILQTMMERDESQLKETWGRFMGLGLALLYLGKLCFFCYYFIISSILNGEKTSTYK